jgi:hypothetical protein
MEHAFVFLVPFHAAFLRCCFLPPLLRPLLLLSVARDEIPRAYHAYIIPLHHVVVKAQTKAPCMLGTAADAKRPCFGRFRTILTDFYIEFVRFGARAGGGTKGAKG